MRSDGSLAKVGLTVLIALLVLAAAILVIGEQSFLFASTSDYSILFENVGGLDTGSPVQLNGVAVGRVRDIVLSEDPEESLLRVWIEIESKYTGRIRADSVARIKSLGLLGDKYVQLVSGSPGQPPVEPGGQIPADQPTDVDSLIRSGEDVADYVVATAHSLTEILGRLERGEGVVGELLAEREGEGVADTLQRTLDSVDQVAQRIDSGEGTFGRLLSDEELADRVEDSVARLQDLLRSAQEGDGLLPTLLHDVETKDTVTSTLGELQTTVGDLGAVAADLRERRGLANRLIRDEEYAERLLTKLESVVTNLDEISGKIASGEGSVARFINDPQLYDALNDIVVGVNESRLLRWLIRNRQRAGIEKRYDEAQKGEAQKTEDGAGSG